MLSDKVLRDQLPHVLSGTNFDFLGKRYEGKVRDSYIGSTERILVTTDRLSCFDVVVTTVPFKGQVLNELAVHWLRATEHIIQNHLLDVPDPSVMVVKNCEILPIEVVVRGYLTGSAWRDYTAGRDISGVVLPSNLQASAKLEEAILTPSTKAERGKHDEPISEQEILKQGIVEKKLWEQVRETAFALFAFGQKRSAERGLILVDTKYEFGLYNGKLILADEIHTLDSSRFWEANTYEERFRAGEAPEMLDKEPTRQWLLERGYQGSGEIPEFDDEHRVDIARRYVASFQKVSGEEFKGAVGSVEERIRSRLQECQAK